MDMSQYLEIFIEEAKEHLQGLNQSLLQLEQKPNDKSMLNEIFRAAHTLKGMSATMGYTKMAKLTHDMENVLHSLRNNELKVSTKLIDVLFKCLDALEDYLDNIINKSEEGNNENTALISDLKEILSDKLESVTSSTKSPKKVKEPPVEKKQQKQFNTYVTADFKLNQYEQNLAVKAKEIGMNVLKITLALNKGCMLKSARAFIIFQTLEKYSEIIKAVPIVEEIEDENFDFEFTVVVVSKHNEEIFLKELYSISEVEEVLISHMEPKLEISELAITPNVDVVDSKFLHSESLEGDDKKLLVNEDCVDDLDPNHKIQKTGKTVRVDIKRLDVLMNLVSELIIQKTRLEGIEGFKNSQTYSEALESLERITTDLHDSVMKVRMVPVETVFNRFPRMIRDISKELDKEINLNLYGEETELDRTVIDEIGDPLIHLIRNSADHGIESSEKRISMGKPAVGQINLRAYQDGNNVIIEVEDDGSGIDLENVKKKAIQRGLLNKEVAENLSEKDIIDFIFRPSFSTVERITDLSGRGVGLDVVKTKIEFLNGIVEVENVPGKGSKFIIRLPLTLAIIQALLVIIGKEKYAIPLSSIQSIEKVANEEIKLVQKQEVMLLRKSVVPIVRLVNILEVPTDSITSKFLTVVIVKKGERMSGFVVDSLIGQQEIVIKSLGKLLAGIRSIAGATILGDGNVALILDVNSLA